MSLLTNIVKDAGFTGTENEFDTTRDAVVAALESVDAVAPVASTRRPVIDLLSVIRVSGTAAAPVFDCVWRHRPAVHGHTLALEAVVEAALLAISGASVTHDASAEEFGVADMGALATALGL